MGEARYCVIPSGSENSVSGISPGVIGSCGFDVVAMIGVSYL